jgi:PAS domain S-box-containing protein
MGTTYDILWDRCIVGLAELNKDGYFMRANPAFCNLLGYNESELQNKKWKEVTHPEDAVGGEVMFEKAIAGHITSYTMEKRYITKRGQIVWVNLFMSTVQDEHKQVKFLIKQIINTPVIIPTEAVEKNKDNHFSFKENYRLIAAGFIGTTFTIYGNYTGSDEIQNLGIALIVGLLGGIASKK